MDNNQTPPDWVLIEAAKRCGWRPEEWGDMCDVYQNDDCFRALCDMIERYESPPVDRKLLCAREVMKYWTDVNEEEAQAACVRAIELWESGYGEG